MSVITTHELYIHEGTDKTLKELLESDGVYAKRVLKRYDRNDNIVAKELNSVDLSLCSENLVYDNIDKDGRRMSDVKENEEKHLAKGWTITGRDKYFTEFIKPWDKEVYDSLRYRDADITEKDTLIWFRNYGVDQKPAKTISLKYPDITFEYREVMENDLVCHIRIKNGEVIENLLDSDE